MGRQLDPEYKKARRQEIEQRRRAEDKLRKAGSRFGSDDPTLQSIPQEVSGLREVSNAEIEQMARSNQLGLQYREAVEGVDVKNTGNVKGTDTSGGFKKDFSSGAGVVSDSVPDSRTGADREEKSYKKFVPNLDKYYRDAENLDSPLNLVGRSTEQRRRVEKKLEELQNLIYDYGYDQIPVGVLVNRKGIRKAGEGQFADPEVVRETERKLREFVYPDVERYTDYIEGQDERRRNAANQEALSAEQLRAAAIARATPGESVRVDEYTGANYSNIEQAKAAAVELGGQGQANRIVEYPDGTFGIALINQSEPAPPSKMSRAEANQIYSMLSDRRAASDRAAQQEASEIKDDLSLTRQIAQQLGTRAKNPRKITDGSGLPPLRMNVIRRALNLSNPDEQGPRQLGPYEIAGSNVSLARPDVQDERPVSDLEAWVRSRALYGEGDDKRKDLTGYEFANAAADIQGALVQLGKGAYKIKPELDRFKNSPGYAEKNAYYKQIAETGVRSPKEAIDLYEGAKYILEQRERGTPDAERVLEFLGINIRDKDQLTNLATSLDMLDKSLATANVEGDTVSSVNLAQKLAWLERDSGAMRRTDASILWDTKKGQDTTTLEKLGIGKAFRRDIGRKARQAYKVLEEPTEFALLDEFGNPVVLGNADEQRLAVKEAKRIAREDLSSSSVDEWIAPEMTGVDPSSKSSLSAVVKKQPERVKAATNRLYDAAINLRKARIEAEGKPFQLNLFDATGGEPGKPDDLVMTHALVQARREYENAQKALEGELTPEGARAQRYVVDLRRQNNGRIPQTEQEARAAMQRRNIAPHNIEYAIDVFNRQKETEELRRQRVAMNQSQRFAQSVNFDELMVGGLNEPGTRSSQTGEQIYFKAPTTAADYYFMKDAEQKQMKVERQREWAEIDELVKLMEDGAQYDLSDYRKFYRMPDIEFSKLGHPTHKKGDKLVVPRQDELDGTIVASGQTDNEIARFAGFLSRDPKLSSDRSFRKALTGLQGESGRNPFNIRVTTNLNPEDRNYLKKEVSNYLAAQGDDVNLDSGSWSSIRQQQRSQASPTPTQIPEKQQEPGSWMGGSGSGAIAPSPWAKQSTEVAAPTTAANTAITEAAADPVQQARIKKHRLQDIEAVSEAINTEIEVAMHEKPQDTLPKNIMDIYKRSANLNITSNDVDEFSDWIRKEIPNDPVALSEVLDVMGRFPRTTTQAAQSSPPAVKSTPAPKASGPDVIDRIIKKYRREYEAGGPVNKKGDLAAEGALAARQLREQPIIQKNRQEEAKRLRRMKKEANQVLQDIRTEAASRNTRGAADTKPKAIAPPDPSAHQRLLLALGALTGGTGLGVGAVALADREEEEQLQSMRY
jgi:hypothetical protein